MMRMVGKVALITGASNGIGYACAEAFICEGAAVALVDIDAEAGARAVEQLRSASDRVALLHLFL